MHSEQTAQLETLHTIADAELNSERAVHDSFARATGVKSWARYDLKHRVQKIALREGLSLCHEHQCLLVAQRIAADWFAQRA